MNSSAIEDVRAALARGDYVTALEILRPLANDGNASAQWNLGYLYDIGCGIAKDCTEAIKWYSKAADQGDARTQKLLGDICSENGDEWESVKWYRKAADQGYADAQFQLGGLYGFDSEDRHLMYNPSESLKWYRKAADQGHADSQYTLGLIHHKNDNYPAAAKWYRRAAERGHGEAQYAIGKMYIEGLGVERNLVQGYKWISLAALSVGWSNITFPARADCESVAANMTPAQLEQAQTLKRKWKPKCV